MRLNCIRRRLNRNGTVFKEWTEMHVAVVEFHAGNLNSWWVHLRPGVTGYESVAVDRLIMSDKGWQEWSACGGTPGSWDQLIVPADEMERLCDVLRLLPIRKDEP